MSEKGVASAARKCLIYHDWRGRIWLAEKVYILGRKIHGKMPTNNRTAIYLRVSTADQKPDLQFDGLRAYAARAGLEIVREFLDVAVSGRKQGRPQLDALMQAARNYAFDGVLVWKFDRFARSTQHLLMAPWGSASSASRIRSTPRHPWARPCSRSSAPWLSWSPL